MDYDSLLDKYQKLRKENEKLRAENSYLQECLSANKDLKISDFANTQTDISTYTCINQNSPAAQKIELYMSFFKGRPDVYAKRWINHKKGTAGYSPVCTNEWRKGYCYKPKVKCVTCQNQAFAPYDQQAVKAHLTGNVEAGVYPMLDDETCYFLAIDFDKSNWQESTTIIRRICDDWDISCGVERSRSGNGAHIWFFFEEAVPASLARKFGSALLTYAMAKNNQVGFDSYDRLFPNQDTIPAGGLGNLIVLPFQKVARNASNTVFIDENYIPYPDQWLYLSQIRKIKADDLERYSKELAGDDELGQLTQVGKDNHHEKPWIAKHGKDYIDPSSLPSQITLTRANMIYIPKKDLPSKAINQVARMAAFRNPEFYKRQAMRLPTYNNPRIISLDESFENYVALPRGCMDQLMRYFEANSVDVIIEDQVNNGKNIKVEFTGELTEGQKTAANSLLNCEYGVLSAPPGFGKTVLGASLIASRKVNTLILVHLKQLLDQWVDRLNQFLHIDEVLPEDGQSKKGRSKMRSLIGTVSGGKDRRSGLIDVALIQSLYSKNKEDEVNPCLKDYGMVIVDECHHISAFSFEKVIKAAHARYIYGLTATPVRQDGHHPIIFMHCGPIRSKVDALSQSEKRPFEHIVIPSFTAFRMPPEDNSGKWQIQKIYTAITESETRNQMIVNDTLEALTDGRNPIILAHRTSHVENLADLLKGMGVEVFVLTGRLSEKQRRLIRQQLTEMATTRRFAIVATGKYIGEGFDYARLDTLLLASPVAWHGTVQQYIGRLHRLYQKKQEVRVIDYVDIHEPVLEKMYYKRMKAYTAAGYTIKSPDKDGEEVEILYDRSNYWEKFCQDISGSHDQVIITSPYLNQRQVENTMAILKPALQRGVRVTILTRPLTAYKEADLKKADKCFELIEAAGVMVILREDMQQRLVVIDNSVVWYGSISFLSYSKKEADIMRINNRDLAVDISTGMIKAKLNSLAERG